MSTDINAITRRTRRTDASPMTECTLAPTVNEQTAARWRRTYGPEPTEVGTVAEWQQTLHSDRIGDAR